MFLEVSESEEKKILYEKTPKNLNDLELHCGRWFINI